MTKGIKNINYTMSREQSLVIFGFRGTTLKNKDRYALAVLSSIMSGQDGRLYRSIRSSLGLSYALGVFQMVGIEAGYFASYVATDKKHIKAVKTALFKELKKAGEDTFTEEEIELAKSSLIGRRLISLQSPDNLAYQMALDEIYGLGYDNYRNYSEFISAVKKSDIIRVARKYLDLEDCAIVSIVGEKGD